MQQITTNSFGTHHSTITKPEVFRIIEHLHILLSILEAKPVISERVTTRLNNIRQDIETLNRLF